MSEFEVKIQEENAKNIYIHMHSKKKNRSGYYWETGNGK